MYKQNAVYTSNGILFSLKKQGCSDMCYNMNESQSNYAQWNKPDKVGQILYDCTYMRFLEYSSS